MDYIKLLKILIEWSINSKEYELLYFIYCNFGVGLPVKFLYKLPDQSIFNTLEKYTLNILII